MAGIVILDQVHASKHGNLKHGVHTSDLEQGSFVHLGALKANERELYNIAVPATASLLDEVLLVASPELLYDTTGGAELSRFTNKANKPFRLYHLQAGDTITISDSMFTGATTLNQFVVPQNGNVKLAAAATDPGTTRFVGKVIEKWNFGINAVPVTTIRVVKA